MERAIVTFLDPKTGQKIIVNLNHDTNTDDLDVTCKFDPTPNEDDKLGLIGYLSELFLKQLYGTEGQDTSAESSGG